jgi:FKBP12-rapamycin complex-associated protein
LCQADHIKTLFLALNDEVFIVREISIKIIARLVKFNPAYVIASLRKLLIKLLTELEYSTNQTQREESCSLASLLIGAVPSLIESNIEPTLKTLMGTARDSRAGVASKALQAIGELSCLDNQIIIPHLDQLMLLFLDTLQDSSSSIKIEAAILSLWRVCSKTGWVIDPYFKYPTLLSTLLSILKSEQSLVMRRYTMKAFGVLGALDPYRFNVLLLLMCR